MRTLETCLLPNSNKFYLLHAVVQWGTARDYAGGTGRDGFFLTSWGFFRKAGVLSTESSTHSWCCRG